MDPSNHTSILDNREMIGIKAEGGGCPNNEIICPDVNGNKPTFTPPEEQLHKPEMNLQTTIQHESISEPVKNMSRSTSSSFHPLSVRKYKSRRSRNKAALEVVSIDNLQDKLFLQQFFRCTEFPDGKSHGSAHNNKMNSYLRLLSMPRNYSKNAAKYGNCEGEVDSFILRRRERNRERMRKLRSNPEYAAKEKERVRERKRIKTLFNLQKQTIDSSFTSALENAHTYIIPEKFEHLMKIRAYNREMQRKRRSNPEYAAKERERNREYQRQRRKMKAEMRNGSSDLNAALFGKILQCNLEVDPNKLIPECNIEGSSDSIQSEVDSHKMSQSSVYNPNGCTTSSQMYSPKCLSNNFDVPVHNTVNSVKRILPPSTPFDESYIIQMIKREKNRESMRRRRSDPEYRRKEKERRRILAEERRQSKLIPM